MIDNQITWNSNQLTTKSLDVQSIDNQSTWISNRLNPKAVEAQMNWQQSQIWNQLIFDSIEFHTFFL